MPLSFGIVIGLGLTLFGIILFYSSSYKKAAKGIILTGLLMVLFTVIVVILAVNSAM